MADNGHIVGVDHAIALFVERHNTEWGEAIFYGVSQLGSTLLTVVVATTTLVLFRRGHRDRALAVATVSISGWILEAGLKRLFHRGRPESASEFIHFVSWSFPSGHAMNATICYGFLTVLLIEFIQPRRRYLVVAGASALILLVGFSRVYLGVHYVSDVIAGYLAGIVWLATCSALYLSARYRANRRAH